MTGLLYLSLSTFAQHPTYDDQKEKQWKSMENGPWGLCSCMVLLLITQEI